MGLFGFLLATCAIPGWNSFAIQTGWVLLSISLPFMLVRRLDLGPAHWLGLAFLLYAVISVSWTYIPEQGIWALWLLSIAAGGFVLGSSDLDFTKLYIGLALGIGVSTNIAIFQLFGFHALPQYAGGLSGLFVNSGVFGEVAALVTIVLVASNIFWPTILTIPAIFLSNSRTALAAIAACVTLALLRAYGVKALIAIAILFTAFTAYASKRGTASLEERFAIWRDTIDGITPLGHGAGSFTLLYPTFAKRTDTMLTRPEMAHNEFLELAFEYGIGSILLGGVIVLALLSTFTGPERYLALGFLVVAFFGFPRQIPIETLLGTIALGRLCAGRYSAWNLGLYRGSIRHAWGR